MSLFDILRKGPLKVTVIGAGNWGTAVSIIAAENCSDSYLFHDTVTLWVHDEVLSDGRKASQHINEDGVNSRYLPGIQLPKNIYAEPDIVKSVSDADLILLILPHQFVVSTASMIRGKVKKSAKCISLVKGIYVDKEALDRPQTFSDVIEQILGVECSALSGANVAKDVANKEFSEATIGYKQQETAGIWHQLLDRPYFRIRAVPDVYGIQVCGALKNIVALAAGFCDGMEMGTNTKSAIIRIGTDEIKLFATLFFEGILEETFFESCGFADVITTCFGGRNVRCAAEFIRRNFPYKRGTCKPTPTTDANSLVASDKEPAQLSPYAPRVTWDVIEEEMLNGMKMQGQLTCFEVHQVLEANKLLHLFPMIRSTYKVAFEYEHPISLIQTFSESLVRDPLKTKEECSKVVMPRALRQLGRDLKAFQLKKSLSLECSSPS